MNKLIAISVVVLALCNMLECQDGLTQSAAALVNRKQLKAQIQAEKAKNASLTGSEKTESQETIKALQAQFKALRQTAAKNNNFFKSKSQASIKRAANKSPKDPLANLENSLSAIADKVALIDNQMVNDITQIAESNAQTDTSVQKKQAALETAQKATNADQAATQAITAFESLITESAAK